MKKVTKFDIRRSPFRSRVDIIIPYHGQYHLVRKLMDSILKLTSSPEYRIILVDDGSPNESFIELWNKYGMENRSKNEFGERSQPKITGVRLDNHVGFGGALQAGYNASNSPYVCFLNSDCVIKNPVWLQAMGESLLKLKSQNVRLVSARSNNPVSEIPELKSEDATGLDEDVIVDQHLPLFCAMCHRELFPRIGGFIKNYPYGMYEDEELYHRMKKYYMQQAVCAKSWVYHKGEATLKKFFHDEKIKDIILNENFNRLKEDVRKL